MAGIEMTITRRGDLSIAADLYQMRVWLDGEAIRAIKLRAVRVLDERVTFAAMFESAADADRFRQAFDCTVIRDTPARHAQYSQFVSGDNLLPISRT